MNIDRLKESIKRTNMASTGGLKKDELVDLKFKIDQYIKNNITSNSGVNYKEFFINNRRINLTDDQAEIVTAPLDSHYKVIACAGSGKTTTIILRIKYLIDKGVKPHEIMLTSFNVDAVENMRAKINDVFGFTPNLYLGTIDALAYRFYNAYFKRDNFVGVSEYCTEFLKFLESNSETSKNLKKKFKYVFFDEFQDCNDIQFNIIKQLSENSKITIIGDDAQNIYQWRGSNIDFIMNFETFIDKCQIKTLLHNFRSTPEIINMANASISKNADHIPKQMMAVNKSHGRLPKIAKYNSEDEQAKYTVAMIARYIANDIKQEEIAVLARNNYSIKYVEEEIEKYNITVTQTNSKAPKINYVALISDDTRDTNPKIMKNHITLTTIHKSKGLEWDVVFIISCNDDKFPSETSQIKIQEDRRLFYVSITRAKRYLNISFTSKALTRFVGELDKSLYSFDKALPQYFVYKDERSIKFKNGVTQLIEMLEPKDIEDMRRLNLIPEIVPFTVTVHGSHKYQEQIDKYYLQTDYGIYIDRYISRQLGIVIPNSGGLIDSVANRVLHTLTVSGPLYSLYMEYNFNIQKKIDQYVINNQESLQDEIDALDIYKFIDLKSTDPPYIKRIDPKCKIEMLKLIQMIVERSLQIFILPSQLFVTPVNYMPLEFQKKFEQSYANFRKDVDGDIIKKDIYNTSLCQNVYDGRRRLLYRDCFEYFDSDQSLYQDINNWVNRYKNHKIITKKYLIHEKLSICGELDMIDLTESAEKIIDFKCSLNSDFKLEWLIQLMMYSALYKYNHKKVVNKLVIYNPLKGTVTEVDLDQIKWDKHEKLLEYMDKIRTIKLKGAN